MEKIKDFANVVFDAQTFFNAHEVIKSLAPGKLTYHALAVQVSSTENWNYDTFEEFLAAANSGVPSVQIYSTTHFAVHIIPFRTGTRLQIRVPKREQIEQIFSIFATNVERCRRPEPPPQPVPKPKVFIGHGRDPQWKDLKDHLHEKHGYAVEAYEIGSRAGHTIRDILQEMLKSSSIALLVMTAEDETKDGKFLARQNVVHEAGLFQGRLGFSRAIILLEDGTEQFSNIEGLQQVRFPKGKIRETFGDVLAVLKRELEN